jgi:type II secretory pathway pseudopilin PulG
MVKGTNEMTSLSTLARAARLGSTRKRGVTLIEAVLYISIALALIVGGLVFFQQASLAQRTNSAVRNISAIASETRGLYQSAQNFSGVSTATLINAGAVPTSIVVPAAGTTPASLRNEWSGPITVASADPFATFTVDYENIPTATCTRLTSSDKQGAGRVGSGIVEVGYRLSTGTDYTKYQSADDELTPNLVAGYCNTAAGTTGLVDVQFTFNR